jgi:hypothetical protein
MQGDESSEQCNKNEFIRAPSQKDKTSGSRNHYRRISRVEQRVRINQPRPSLRELEEVLAACPLCVAGRHSDLVEQSAVLQQALDSGQSRR